MRYKIDSGRFWSCDPLPTEMNKAQQTGPKKAQKLKPQAQAGLAISRSPLPPKPLGLVTKSFSLMPSSAAERKSFHRKFPARKFYTKWKKLCHEIENQIETSLNDFWGRTISSNFSLFPRPFDLGLNCHLHYFKSCEYIGGRLKGGMWESIQEICSLENPSQTVLTSNIHFESERNKISNPNHSGKFISPMPGQAGQSKEKELDTQRYTHILCNGLRN